METYTINGKTIEFDTFDVASFAAVSRESERVSQRISSLTEDIKGDPVGYMTEVCSAVRSFFETVVGPGTADVLFGTSNNFRDMMEAYASFAEQVSEHVKGFAAGVKK